MTAVTQAAEAAREGARTSIGQFGEQQHSVPEMTVTAFPYPALKNGIPPENVDINIWYREAESGTPGSWNVTASPYQENRFGVLTTDVDVELFPAFDIPLTDGRAAELQEDQWISLTTAPTWLRDAVLPSLVEVDADDPETLTWHAVRHEQVIAAGGLASSYDNEYIAEFEERFPSGMPADAALGLRQIRPLDGEPANASRELAAAELSRLAAQGVGGLLVDARHLRPGDQVSLAHLASHFPDHESWPREQYATITRSDASGAGGTITLALDEGRAIDLPTGARLPALGYEYDGRQFTSSALVAELVGTHEMSYRESMALNAPHFVVQHNTRLGLQPGDPASIDFLVPTLNGARL